MRTELLAAARRGGAFGDVRALQLDVAQIPTSLRETPPAVLSLEEFRERVDPDSFYGEAELLALYQEQHPAPDAGRRAARIARLRERQGKALAALERVLVLPPSPDDPPSAWLEAATAQRIEAVGLSTLGKLTDWIAQRGQRWWTVVPRVGEVAAARVVDWLRRNAEALGIRLDASVTMSRRELVSRWRAVKQPVGVLAPLDRVMVPSELDGSNGTNRLQGASRLGASNDREAIEAWIAARAGSNTNTQRAYRREAERLLLWAIFERRRPVSSLAVEDAIAFRAFLRDPQPAARWVGKGRAARLSPDWRPFNGALSAGSVAHAITVVGSLFDWLVRQHYLVHNPFSALPREKPISAAEEADPDRLEGPAHRYLTSAQWAIIRRVLPTLGDDEVGLRARLAIVLGYTTGMRLSELADARVGRLTVQADDSTEIDQTQDDAPAEPNELSSAAGRRVSLLVLGKGGKMRTVPIVPQVERLIDSTLASRGLPDWVTCQREGLNGVRLLGPLSGRRPVEEGLSNTMVYAIVKRAFGCCEAISRKRGMDRDAEVFSNASTHWLRHTFGRHALASGVKPNIVQAILGHASLATTTRYSTEDGDAAWDAVRAFTNQRV